MKSLWYETTNLPKFPKLDKNIKTDVLVIGGGLCGILCAYMLKNSGVHCVLVEKNSIFSGVSGKTTAKITSQHGLIYDKIIREFGFEAARKYYLANESALEEYRRICKGFDCDFEDKNSYIYTTTEIRKLEKEMDALQKLGIKAMWHTKLDLPFEILGAIQFSNQAQLNPLKFIKRISSGLNIYENTEILSFDGECYHTDSCDIYAKKSIVATHFPMFNKHGAYFLKLYQHRSYVLGLENATTVKGMYKDICEYGLSFRNYKGLLLLGGGSHRTGKNGGGWIELEKSAKKIFPNSKVSYRWATQDCMSLDGLPYIGRYSKNTPNMFTACGFNKWGFTSAMAAAQILSDLLQEKKNEYSGIFEPSRTIFHPQLAVNICHTASNFLIPKTPRCTHLGCALTWNKQEHSWDCSCHGSRFTNTGLVLDNPAKENLKRKGNKNNMV